MESQSLSEDDVVASVSVSPSPVLLMIYSAMVTILLVVFGTIEAARHWWPEPPEARFARAVQTLESGNNQLALQLFSKLVEKGNPAAEYWLADMNEFGLGTAKNMSEAERLLESSAAQEFVPAQVRLGEIYLSGIDVAPKYERAIALLTSAAHHGSTKAKRLLGQIYAVGIGIAKDPVLAKAYLSAAATGGDKLASAELERLQVEALDGQRKPLNSKPHRRKRTP